MRVAVTRDLSPRFAECERVICARHYPRTLARLRAAGIEALPVDAGEVSKAEGAVTCCSLVFDVVS